MKIKLCGKEFKVRHVDQLELADALPPHYANDFFASFSDFHANENNIAGYYGNNEQIVNKVAFIIRTPEWIPSIAGYNDLDVSPNMLDDIVTVGFIPTVTVKSNIDKIGTLLEETSLVENYLYINNVNLSFLSSSVFPIGLFIFNYNIACVDNLSDLNAEKLPLLSKIALNTSLARIDPLSIDIDEAIEHLKNNVDIVKNDTSLAITGFIREIIGDMNLEISNSYAEIIITPYTADDLLLRSSYQEQYDIHDNELP